MHVLVLQLGFANFLVVDLLVLMLLCVPNLKLILLILLVIVILLVVLHMVRALGVLSWLLGDLLSFPRMSCGGGAKLLDYSLRWVPRSYDRVGL